MNELALKLACLASFYERYFLPVHMNVFSSSVVERVSAAPLKLIAGSSVAENVFQDEITCPDVSVTFDNNRYIIEEKFYSSIIYRIPVEFFVHIHNPRIKNVTLKMLLFTKYNDTPIYETYVTLKANGKSEIKVRVPVDISEELRDKMYRTGNDTARVTDITKIAVYTSGRWFSGDITVDHRDFSIEFGRIAYNYKRDDKIPTDGLVLRVPNMCDPNFVLSRSLRMYLEETEHRRDSEYGLNPELDPIFAGVAAQSNGYASFVYENKKNLSVTFDLPENVRAAGGILRIDENSEYSDAPFLISDVSCNLEIETDKSKYEALGKYFDAFCMKNMFYDVYRAYFDIMKYTAVETPSQDDINALIFNLKIILIHLFVELTNDEFRAIKTLFADKRRPNAEILENLIGYLKLKTALISEGYSKDERVYDILNYKEDECLETTNRQCYALEEQTTLLLGVLLRNFKEIVKSGNARTPYYVQFISTEAIYKAPEALCNLLGIRSCDEGFLTNWERNKFEFRVTLRNTVDVSPEPVVLTETKKFDTAFLVNRYAFEPVAEKNLQRCTFNKDEFICVRSTRDYNNVPYIANLDGKPRGKFEFAPAAIGMTKVSTYSVANYGVLGRTDRYSSYLQPGSYDVSFTFSYENNEHFLRDKDGSKIVFKKEDENKYTDLDYDVTKENYIVVRNNVRPSVKTYKYAVNIQDKITSNLYNDNRSAVLKIR